MYSLIDFLTCTVDLIKFQSLQDIMSDRPSSSHSFANSEYYYGIYNTINILMDSKLSCFFQYIHDQIQSIKKNPKNKPEQRLVNDKQIKLQALRDRFPSSEIVFFKNEQISYPNIKSVYLKHISDFVQYRKMLLHWLLKSAVVSINKYFVASSWSLLTSSRREISHITLLVRHITATFDDLQRLMPCNVLKMIYLHMLSK